MKRSLVLIGGGLKSAYLVAEAKREGEILCLSFEHMGLTRYEYAATVTLTAHFQVPLLWKELSFPRLFPLQRFIHVMFHALAIAKVSDCRIVYYGLSRDDVMSSQVKSLEPFVDQLQSLILQAQPRYGIRGAWLAPVEFETPLRRLVVGQVIRLGNELDIPWELTWSCEVDSKVHCGECFKCLRRRRAFSQEGHSDPTTYAK